jgi:exosortase A-associated hydrolase 2
VSIITRQVPFEPFFLPASSGERFCIHYPGMGVPRGGVVYVHPFAEEMNKSRRMAALQARSLAAAGYAVLQIDLYGCGDSHGDFLDANWETWCNDVALAASWLSQRTSGGLTLWGLRLGALLALDAARLCDPQPNAFVLWQPALTGDALLTQFLRLRLASDMLSGSGAATGAQEMRAQLAAGCHRNWRMRWRIWSCQSCSRPMGTCIGSKWVRRTGRNYRRLRVA